MLWRWLSVVVSLYLFFYTYHVLDKDVWWFVPTFFTMVAMWFSWLMFVIGYTAERLRV